MNDDKARKARPIGNTGNSGGGDDVSDVRAEDGRPSVPVASRPSGLTAGLECRVGKAPIVVPVEHVAQIIEYETSPLPLTRRWITGVGLHGDRLVMTVGLMADAVVRPKTERRRTRGVLLTAQLQLDDSRDKTPRSMSTIAWALEVQEVLVLVRAEVIEQKRGIPRVGDLPPWIARARTNDGRSIGWIDVPAMLADLTSPPRSFA